MDPVRQNPIWITCKPLQRMCNNRMLHITTIRSSLLMFPLTPDQQKWPRRMRDDAVLRRALPLGRGLGRTVEGPDVVFVGNSSFWTRLCNFCCFHFHSLKMSKGCQLIYCSPEHVSEAGAENGAGPKIGWAGAGLKVERERSGRSRERAKSAAHNPLKPNNWLIS